MIYSQHVCITLDNTVIKRSIKLHRPTFERNVLSYIYLKGVLSKCIKLHLFEGRIKLHRPTFERNVLFHTLTGTTHLVCLPSREETLDLVNKERVGNQ